MLSRYCRIPLHAYQAHLYPLVATAWHWQTGWQEASADAGWGCRGAAELGDARAKLGTEARPCSARVLGPKFGDASARRHSPAACNKSPGWIAHHLTLPRPLWTLSSHSGHGHRPYFCPPSCSFLSLSVHRRSFAPLPHTPGLPSWPTTPMRPRVSPPPAQRPPAESGSTLPSP